jgi:hypothetical protein
MNVVVVYLRLYAQCVGNALGAIARNGWTLLLPMGLVVAFMFLATLLAPLGLVGGFLLAFARTAGASAYCYFLAMLVGKQRTGLFDLKKSLGAYFWSWMNLFFVLWIVDLALGAALATNPQRGAMLSVVSVMELFALNAAPETIYLKGSSGGLETVQRSFAFLQDSWVEWLAPNALFLAGAWWLVQRGAAVLFFVPFGSVGIALLGGALLHGVMVFRGFLFEALDGSTHRQRMFRYRTPPS